MLGVSIGREEYVKDHLTKKTEEHQVVIDRIPLVQDLLISVVGCCSIAQGLGGRSG